MDLCLDWKYKEVLIVYKQTQDSYYDNPKLLAEELFYQGISKYKSLLTFKLELDDKETAQLKMVELN